MTDLPRARIAGMRFPHSQPGSPGPGEPVGELKKADQCPLPSESVPSASDQPKRRAPVASVARRKTKSQQAQITAWRKLADRKGRA